MITDIQKLEEISFTVYCKHFSETHAHKYGHKDIEEAERAISGGACEDKDWEH